MFTTDPCLPRMLSTCSPQGLLVMFKEMQIPESRNFKGRVLKGLTGGNGSVFSGTVKHPVAPASRLVLPAGKNVLLAVYVAVEGKAAALRFPSKRQCPNHSALASLLPWLPGSRQRWAPVQSHFPLGFRQGRLSWVCHVRFFPDCTQNGQTCSPGT